METMKKTLLLFTVMIFCTGIAQENIFLSRDYWKANPSIDQIEKDIAAGNDVSQRNAYAFDAVCYAFLEKADNSSIKYLLSKKGNEVNKLTHDGRTYIFWAAYKDNLEMMQYLLDRGAKTDIVDDHGYSLLNFSAVTGQTNTALYDFILASGAKPKDDRNRDGANALLLVAPFAKDFEIFDYFIAKGLSMQDMDTKGNGVFEYAARGGNTELLQNLIDKGIGYKKSKEEGGNAILMASQGTRGKQNTLETYKFLAELGIEVNTTDTSGRNALHNIAYRSKDFEVFNFFLKEEIDVNQKDEDGRTPFMNAANYNNLEIVKLLAEAVTDINITDKEGRTALTMAVSRNTPEVVEFLLSRGADAGLKDTKGNSLAYYVIQSYNPKKPEAFEEKLRLVESKGVTLTAVQHDGNTLCHLAAKDNNLALLKRLKAIDIPINAKNNDGNTVLHLAAMSATDDAILRYLIAEGADKSALTDFEESVFDLASENELLKANEIALEFLK
ncbi:MAG: ankyrin repeat domain-containing protein [Bacteroidota bacterium]